MASIHNFLLVAMCLVALPRVGNSQTTESLAVNEIARESPEWLVEAVRADDFRESGETTAVETQPYSAAIAGRIPLIGPVKHQPAGALTGKVTFTMAGHGWTYDSDKMYYYTQRGLSHGMVEDMGNADQMHIFAHLLFNAGATVVPLKPVDYQPNERVLDNQMPQVELYGEWKQGSSTQYYGAAYDEIPYVYSAAALEESAVARYRPYIPEAGYYPVYVWARDGSDRSNQLYRVAYTGGQAEVRVNWRTVGKTWVWLGTYYFEKGDTGYVETTNQVIDPYEAYQANVVIADAVRFGNGRGDVQRPGGISGYSREDEGDSYWIERGLGVNADRRLFDTGRDGNSTVSSPPKAAAYANRESVGTFLDRVLISFHSNASSGKARGAVALFNASPQQRPSYQESFAELIGHEVNRQMKAETPPAGEEWVPRERNTYSGINFGELRRDYLQNEMCATIVETAFHDNKDDVDFLLDPRARIQMAQATLRGLLRWYGEVAYPNSAYVLPPARPVAISATVEGGQIQVKWKRGAVGEFDGGPATKVRIYRSSNGYGYDGGVIADADAEFVAVDPVTTAGATFIRVTALNGAGESLPSQSVAAFAGAPAKGTPQKATATLLLPLVTVLDRSVNVPYDLDRQPGGPYRRGASTERVRAIYALLEPAGVEEAKALAALGHRFNGASSTAVKEGLVNLENYERIFMPSEMQNPASPLLSVELQDALRGFLAKAGKLYASGGGLALNMTAHGQKGEAFVRDVLGAVKPSAVQLDPDITSTDNRFMPTTNTLLAQTKPTFWDEAAVNFTQFQIRKNRSISLLSYTNSEEASFAAGLTRPAGTTGEVFYFGFPLGAVQNPTDRTNLIAAVLKQM